MFFRRMTAALLVALVFGSPLGAGNPNIWDIDGVFPDEEICPAIDQLVSCFGDAPGTPPSTLPVTVVALLEQLKADDRIKVGTHPRFGGEFWPDDVCICLDWRLVPGTFEFKLTVWHEGFHLGQWVRGKFGDPRLRFLPRPPGVADYRDDLYDAAQLVVEAYAWEKVEMATDIAELLAIDAAPELSPTQKEDLKEAAKASFADHLQDLNKLIGEIRNLLDGLPEGSGLDPAWTGAGISELDLRASLRDSLEDLEQCVEELEAKLAEVCG